MTIFLDNLSEIQGSDLFATPNTIPDNVLILPKGRVTDAPIASKLKEILQFYFM